MTRDVERLTLEGLARGMHDVRLSSTSRLILAIVYFAPPNTPATVIAQRAGMGVSTTRRAISYLRHFGYLAP